MHPSNTSLNSASSYDQSGPSRNSTHSSDPDSRVKNQAGAHTAEKKAASLSPEQQANNQELQTIILNNPLPEKPGTGLSSPQGNTKTEQSKANEIDQISINDLLNQDKTGIPPLHNAILRNNLRFAKILLKNGAAIATNISPPIKQSNQNVNFIFNLENNNTYPTVASLHEPIVNFATHKLNTVGDHAFPYIGFNAITLAISTNQDSEFIKDLCITGKENDPSILNRCDENGQTPLCLAAKEGNIALVKLLIELGANPNTPDKNENVPFTNAIKNGSSELKLTLINSGADCPNHGKSLSEHAFETGDIALMLAYKNYSEKNADSVKKFLLTELNTVTHQSDMHLREFLEFIEPITDENTLHDFFINTAAIPGSISKLMIIQDKFNNPLPEHLLFDLRIAASESQDANVYAYAIQMDEEMIDRLNEPGSLSMEDLSKELNLAIAANSNEFVEKFLSNSDYVPRCEEYKEYSLMARLANMKTDKPIHEFIVIDSYSIRYRHLENFDKKLLEPFYQVKTAHGFKRLLEALGNSLSSLHMSDYIPLIRKAMEFNVKELLDLLLSDESTIDSLNKFSFKLFSPLFFDAINHKNTAMVEYLISKGLIPSLDEFQDAQRQGSRYEDLFLQARMNASKAGKKIK